MTGTDHLFKRYQIFISSTYLDLEEQRESLTKHLNKNKYIVEGMEGFPAANRQQWDIIKNRINKSDVFVLIIADRYGSIAEHAHQMEQHLVKRNEKISYTHLEFRYAKSIGLPILAFLGHNKFNDAGVEKFMMEIHKADNISPGYWKDTVSLVTGVSAALGDLLEDKAFESQNGWVKVKSLNTPIDANNKSVYLQSKIHYVKFISYANKLKSEYLYKKFVPRLNKEIEVWDEYVTLTINQLSHLVNEFQAYFRTDGDAVDFSSLFPFINKLTFTDTSAMHHDRQLNPMINAQSSNYVFANSYYNGFQDGIMDIAVKATKFTREMKMIVDFTSISDFQNQFILTECIQVNKDGSIIDLKKDYTVIQPGIYLIERNHLEEDTVLKFKFN